MLKDTLEVNEDLMCTHLLTYIPSWTDQALANGR